MRFEPAGMTDDPDIRMAASVMDYIFRRLALDFLPYDTRAELGIFTAKERAAQIQAEMAAEAAGTAPEVPATPVAVDLAGMAASAPVAEPAETQAPKVVAEKAAPKSAGSSTELLEIVLGQAADAPLCFTCGTKMRRAGSCYVCEGCGSTSGCS
jgi:ribonucleoside-diphosphate reductase alpha chain